MADSRKFRIILQLLNSIIAWQIAGNSGLFCNLNRNLLNPKKLASKIDAQK
jgi:hypothetical protein